MPRQSLNHHSRTIQPALIANSGLAWFQNNAISLIACSAVCMLAAACSATSSPPAISAKLGGQLTLPQIDAVTLAAREMTRDPNAQVYGLTSKPSLTGTGSLDVCGYVRRNAKPELPLYVEVGTNEAKANTVRGQIGANAANLAKVRFMCRDHAGW